MSRDEMHDALQPPGPMTASLFDFSTMDFTDPPDPSLTFNTVNSTTDIGSETQLFDGRTAMTVALPVRDESQNGECLTSTLLV